MQSVSGTLPENPGAKYYITMGSDDICVIRWYFSRWDNVCKPYNYTGKQAFITSWACKLL
jgi:hypothetical protein